LNNEELKDKQLPGQLSIDKDFVYQTRKLLEKFFKYIPVLTVKNTSNSGSLLIILAGYDGKQFVEKPLKTLNPGESFVATTMEMKNVPDLVPTEGTHLLVRIANMGQEGSVEFIVDNTHTRFLHYTKGYPAVFPYWGNAMNVLIEFDIEKDKPPYWPDELFEGQQAAMYYGGPLKE